MDDNYTPLFGSEELENISAPLLQTVLDTIPVGVYVLKALRNKNRIMDFEYTLVNKEAKKYTKGIDLEGESLLRMNDDQKLFKRLVRVTETGTEAYYTDLITVDHKEHLFSVKCVKFNGGALLTYQDVTQQTEQRVSESKKLFQGIIDAPNLGIAVFKAIRDKKGSIKDFQCEFVNKRTIEAWGGKDGTGTFLSDYGNDGIEQFNYFKKAVETGEKNSYPRKVDMGGWFLISNAPLDNDRLVHVWEDITEMKKEEEELAENRKLLQSILDVSHTAIAYLKAVRDEDDKIIDFQWDVMNELASKQAGREHLIGQSCLGRYPGIKLTGVFEKFVRCIQEDLKQDFEVHYTYDGLNHWIRVMTSKLGDGLVVSSEDITERKKGDQELLQVKGQLRRQLREKIKAIKTIDEVAGLNFSILKSVRDENNEIVDFEWTFASQEQHRVLAAKNLVGVRLSEAYPLDKEHGLFDKYFEVVKTGRAASVESPYQRDGIEGWFEVTAIKHGDGLAVMVKDITDRRNAVQEVLRLKDVLAQNATDKYFSIFNSIDEGFHLVEAILDENENIIDLAVLEENPAAKFLFGESLAGTTVRQAHPEYDTGRFKVWKEVLDTGESMRLTRYSDIWKKWFDFHLTRMGGKDSKQIASIFRDITERMEAEEALRKSEERLAAELADLKKLQSISSRIIEGDNLQDLYEVLVDAAMAFMHSDFASLQVLSPEKNELLLLAHKNFLPESAKYWQTVNATSGSSCAVALAENKRIIIPDLEMANFAEEAKDLRFYRLSGIRSVQSTPLVTRSGHTVGMISTHWKKVYEPREHEFKFLDVLARQAADLLERMQREDALQKSREMLAADLADMKQLQAFSTHLIQEDNVDAIYEQLLNAASALMHAEIATMQLLDPERNELSLLAYKGIEPEAAKTWTWVKHGGESSCGMALLKNTRIVIPDVENSTFITSREAKSAHRNAGLRAAHSTPLITRSGSIIGMISTHWKAVHEPAERELRLMDVLARQAADLLERKQKEDALSKSREKLAADLADTRQLQRLSSQLITEDNPGAIYEEILRAGTSIMHTDMGCIQLLVPDNDALLLIAHRGFDNPDGEFWQWVKRDAMSSCGRALDICQRVIIPDVDECSFMKGTKYLEAYQALGIRALQSTPLITRSGQIVGMITTHWKTSYEPSDRQLDFLDILARQAADFLERMQRETKFLSRLQQEVHDRTVELNDSKELLQNIAETIPDMISVQEYPSRKVVFYNRDSYALNGLSADELSKMTIEERHNLVHPDDIGGMKKYADGLQTLSDEDIATFEYRVRSKLQEWIWLRTRSKVFERDEHNNVISIVNTIQNITAQKEIEQEVIKSLALLQQSEEIAETGTWEYDISKGTLTWSDGMYRLFERKKGTSVTPSVYRNFVIEEDRGKVLRLFKNMEVTFSTVEITLRLKINNDIRTIKTKATALKDDQGRLEKILGVDMDISRQVKSAGEIVELNTELVAKNKDLEALNSELKTFNTIAAKDYKETIQILYTNLEYIVSNEAVRLSNASRGNIRKAQAAIQRMKLLTDDINRYVTLYDVKLNKSVTDPNPLVESVLSQMKSKIEMTEANIQFAPLPELLIDPVLFMRLMIHLLDNSLKFRQPSSAPVISIKAVVTDLDTNLPDGCKPGRYVDISFRDNGIGLDKQYEEKIFELFYTVHEKTKFKGSGTGLAICKKIMTMHNGLISAVANKDRGISVHCFFPAIG